MNNSAVRDANATTVAALVREQGPLSRAQLVRAGGLTRPTVMAIVRALITDNTIREIGSDENVVILGRPDTMLAFNANRVSVLTCVIRNAVFEPTLADTYGSELGQAKIRCSATSPRLFQTLAVSRIG